ncbi:Solute-binding protein [Caprobacter fermentans]|uniref:Solute-binding protein n=1 Tax=Caproicibacter fermentans TaxID=2576756 RepID=A0A6N8I4Q9_9FIRM|nr:TRAP transporter substrate-binding protein [Caproicibacter fermentans]MVB12945.1 Solute-binding protein [Caproicibacter fermentans]OCN02514.1 C4-dicarboxylate ABC transporter [Clostridium sp. W14A]
MIRKKSVLSLLLAGAMMVSATACSSAPASSAAGSGVASTASTASAGSTSSGKVGKTVLKCSFNQSNDNPEFKAVQEMSDKLYDATEGRYSIEVSPNELLGSQKDSLELVENGAIEMAIIANSLAENVNSDFGVIGCPYMFDTQDQQKKLFESGALDDLFATTEKSGFDVLAAYSLGPRSIYTDKQIKIPADLSGEKIRVMQSDTMVQMLNLMGGVGTAMSQGDVYSAIQAHTINGGENNIITYTELKHYEVAPYYSFTNHLMIPDLLVINSDVLKKMSNSDHAAMKKLSNESIESMFSMADEETAKCKKEAEAGGAKFFDVDITPFKTAMKPLIDKTANRSDMTKKIYAEIQKIK